MVFLVSLIFYCNSWFLFFNLSSASNRIST